MKLLVKHGRKPPNDALDSIVRQLQSVLGSEYVCKIKAGICLATIRDEELFKQENYSSFRDFIENSGMRLAHLSYDEAQRRIQIAERHVAIEDEIKQSGLNLPMPTSEAQLRPFLRFTPNRTRRLYIMGANQAVKAEVPLSRSFWEDWLKNPVSREIDVTVTPVKPADVETNGDSEQPEDLDLEDEPSKALRSAEAIATLDRIEALSLEGLFPPNMRTEIETELLAISDYELGLWGRHEKHFLEIGRLVSIVPLTVLQAVKLVTRPMEDVCRDLVNLAIARGESRALTVILPGFQIDVRPLKDKDAK